MFGNRLRLGKVLGVPLRIDLSWLLVFMWVTWSLAGSYFPENYPSWSSALTWGLGLLTSVLFFASVLLHELGHALVARPQGMPVKDITLFVFGGAAEIAEEPRTPKKELLMAISGPAVSLALSGAFAILHVFTREASEPLAALGLFLGGINLSLALFNLIPGFPLDGGRVLRAILWHLRHDLVWATRWASRAGQVVAYLLILLGIMRAFSGDWVDGMWVAFIGLFLDSSARGAYYQLTLRNLLEGYVVADIMSRECQFLPPQLTLDVLVDQYLLTNARRCYAVGSRDRILGLLTVHNVRQVPKDDWPSTHVSEVFTPLDRLRKVAPETPLSEALGGMTSEGVNQLPVVVDGTMVGMVTREDVLTFIRNRSALVSDG